MEDRERVLGHVGRRVEVGVWGEHEEEGAAHLVATLDEVRDDGVVLSEISELGPGPVLFCPWRSLRRIGIRPPWLGAPYEELEPGEEPREQEYYELYEHREAPAGEAEFEPPLRDEPSARSLERVVPIAQRLTVGEITVALASLELFGEGLGVLRYRVSYEAGMFEGGIPEPQLVVREMGSGAELPWSPRGSESSDAEADGEVEVRGVPECGELEVEVSRLASLRFDGVREAEEDACDGPWTFRFTV